jgi:molybdopterin synthase catalytic subunit
MLHAGIFPKQSINLFKAINGIYQNLTDKNIGAIFTFIGISKETSTVGIKAVKSVTIESYKEEADKIIQKICEEIKQTFSLNHISIIHLEGDFVPSEPIVCVVVAAQSRSNALQALENAIRRYKTEPPIFKKENYIDGTSDWVS